MKSVLEDFCEPAIAHPHVTMAGIVFPFVPRGRQQWGDPSRLLEHGDRSILGFQRSFSFGFLSPKVRVSFPNVIHSLLACRHMDLVKPVMYPIHELSSFFLPQASFLACALVMTRLMTPGAQQFAFYPACPDVMTRHTTPGAFSRHGLSWGCRT